MLLLYAKYAFLIWVLIGRNHGDILLMRQLSEDQALLGVATCTKRCLQSPLSPPQLQQEPELTVEQHPHRFRQCLSACKGSGGNANGSTLATGPTPATFRKIQENFHLKLACRTEGSLTFRIDWVQHSRVRPKAQTESSQNGSKHESVSDVIYILKVNAVKVSVVQSLIYLSDENFLTIDKLEADTAHNISALAVHEDGAYSTIANEQSFSTLRGGYQPGKMSALKLRKFVTKESDLRHIAAEVEWQPSTEYNCFYDMIYFSMDSQDMESLTPVAFREPRPFYTHTIEGIEFGQQYKVGVRTVNTRNSMESPLEWLVVQAPTCLEWFCFNYTLCAPMKPSNLSVMQKHYREGILALNVSWSLPPYLPDYYTLHILDLHLGSKDAVYNVSQNASYYYIPQIQVLGVSFEVHLVAHTQGGRNATTMFVNKVGRIVWIEDAISNKLILFIIVPVCCILALSTFTVCKRKAKLKRYRQRCKYLEAKELKGSQNAVNQPGDFHLSLMEASACLTLPPIDGNVELDDELEVEPQDVMLQDVLGEGAFGVVRRGVYRKRQVAVKLLKDKPNKEDVLAFKCEIKVLRSVGKHPNIVDIVGYSTKIANRMMLLIEYCSLGNLQNFLREEWKLRQELNAGKLQEKIRHDVKHGKEQSSNRHCSKPRNGDNGMRIEDVNWSVHGALEQIEEEDNDMTASSNTVEIHTLTMGSIVAADNKSYGLHDGRAIGESDVENIDARLDAIGRCTRAKPYKSCGLPKKHRAIWARAQTVTVENREYFGFAADVSADGGTTAQEPLKYVDLLDIAHQVAAGMEFLAQNKVVHRDLAARNVLIAMDRTIKIADFGLSRDVYHENVYRKSGGGKLPIKWLALESLTHQVYTSQSDVWSFGVLLYEITTLGGMPYPSVSPRDLLQLLRQGQRMKRPDGCTDELFALMESCWCSIPTDRPTFAGLKERLGGMVLATGDLPQRQQQQENAHRELSALHSKVKQLIRDEGQYLQPLQ